MAVNTPQAGSTVRTFLCAADLSSSQGYLVSIVPGTPNTVQLGTAGAAVQKYLAGIVVDGGTGANTPVSVCVSGVCRASSGDANVEYGDFITSDAAGQGTTSNGDQARVVGQALEDGADGELFLINVQIAALGNAMADG